MPDSDRDGANRVALRLFAACKVERRVLNHLIEQGREVGFRDLPLDLAIIIGVATNNYRDNSCLPLLLTPYHVRCFQLFHPLFQCADGLSEFRKSWDHGLGFDPDFMRHHGSP